MIIDRAGDENLDIWAEKHEQAGMPHKTSFVEGQHPELIIIHFRNGISENIMTMRCNQHLHCMCGINALLNIWKKSSLPYAKHLRRLGKPISFERRITRYAKPTVNYVFVSRCKIYGVVDMAKEKEINDYLLYIDRVKRGLEDTEENIQELRKEVHRLIKKNAAFINIAPTWALEVI
jgi:hypothetical protein